MSLPASKSKYIQWVLNGLLALAFVGGFFHLKQAGGLDFVLIALAAAASIAALSKHLPLQNVLSAAAIAAVIGGVAHGLSSNPDVSLPFGPIVYSPDAGWKIFNFVPWIIPLLWVIAIFNARGVARLILRPWRKVKTYGFWLIGLAVILAVAFDAALEPFASHVKHFWIWQPTKISFTWHGATPLNFAGWLCASVLILMIATPSLIRKQPGNPNTPDIHPLILWLGALVLFAAGSAEAGLYWAAGLDALIAGITAFFAIRGVRW